jgi:CHAT domain-containing protein
VGEEVREGAEDELTTLARALHYAGFASVVTSLWRVHDLSAWFLMEAFYEELLQSLHAGATLAVGEALRRAQLYLPRLSGGEALERSLAQREVAAREDPSGLRAAWLELAAVAWVEAHCGNFRAAQAAHERARTVFAAAGRGYEEVVAALDHDIFTLGHLGRAREEDADYRRPIFAHPYYWGAFVLLGRWSC